LPRSISLPPAAELQPLLRLPQIKRKNPSEDGRVGKRVRGPSLGKKEAGEQKFAEGFSDAIRQGGQAYKKDSMPFQTLVQDLLLLEPIRKHATLKNFLNDQARYVDALSCHKITASMTYSWCLVAVEYQAKNQECSDGLLDAVQARTNQRKSKFGRLIVLVLERLSLKIGTDAYKICPAIACKALKPPGRSCDLSIASRCAESSSPIDLLRFLQ
jgi:hypothetical protein